LTNNEKQEHSYRGCCSAVLAPLAVFLHTFSASPLPKPEPYTGPLPSATPPQDLAVLSVMTGVNHRHMPDPYDWAVGFEQDAKEMMVAGEYKPLIEYEKMGTRSFAFDSDTGSLLAHAVCHSGLGSKAKLSLSPSKVSMADRYRC
jgi:hypothetical protein